MERPAAAAGRWATRVDRLDALWRRHGRTFWIVHSVWALATGVVVLWLAHERYDRWLRESPVISLVFFATVAFAALNLLLPMLLAIDPSWATPAAAVLAVASAVPLALQARVRGPAAWLRLSGAGLVVLVVAIGFPALVPPAPLRLQDVTFVAGLDRATLEPTRPIPDDTSSGDLGGQLVVLALRGDGLRGADPVDVA